MPETIGVVRPRILIAEDNDLVAEELGVVRGCGYSDNVVPARTEQVFANAILDLLPAATRSALAMSLERVPLKQGEVLEVPGAPVGYVYFPIEGLLSSFVGATAATRIEGATIGRDGMTAPGVLLGDSVSSGQTVVQVSGSAWRIPAATLYRLSDSDPALRRHLLGHVGKALRHLGETLSYSGRAMIVERLAHWLLQATWRLGSRRLEMTHDALAEILGVRRPSVTTSLQVLEGKRLIRSTRRAVVILDPVGLVELARR